MFAKNPIVKSLHFYRNLLHHCDNTMLGHYEIKLNVEPFKLAERCEIWKLHNYFDVEKSEGMINENSGYTWICEATKSSNSPAYSLGWICISSLRSSKSTMEACLPCSRPFKVLWLARGLKFGGILSPPPPMPTPIDWERTNFNLLDNLSITHFFRQITQFQTIFGFLYTIGIGVDLFWKFLPLSCFFLDACFTGRRGAAGRWSEWAHA